MIWFAPFQGVGDDDDFIVRVKRPGSAPEPVAPEAASEELR